MIKILKSIINNLQEALISINKFLDKFPNKLEVFSDDLTLIRISRNSPLRGVEI
jgi:hypothetical protein